MNRPVFREAVWPASVVVRGGHTQASKNGSDFERNGDRGKVLEISVASNQEAPSGAIWG
jgi:hypothetical protein